MKSFKLFFIAAGALALAACQTSQPPGAGLGAVVGASISTPAAPASTPAVRNKVDETIAKSAQAFADQCLLIKSGLTVAPLLVKSADGRSIIANVKIGVVSLCDGAPPTDVPTALAKLAKLYVDLTTASPELKSYMDERATLI